MAAREKVIKIVNSDAELNSQFFLPVGQTGEDRSTRLIFDFDALFLSLTNKRVVFRTAGGVLMDPALLASEIVDGKTIWYIEIPADCFDAAGELKFSVWGTDADGRLFATAERPQTVREALSPLGGTAYATYVSIVDACINATEASIIQTGLCQTATRGATDVTAYAQNKLDTGAFNGAQGTSAYMQAVYNGFEGTAEEWLASLVGAAGPNSISALTATNITGLLAGNGTNVSAPTSAQVGALPIPDAGGLFADDTINGAFETLGLQLNQINPLEVHGGNLYKFPDHYTANYYSNITGQVMPAAGWGLAKVPVMSNTTYSIYMPTGMYDIDVGGFGFYNGFTQLSYIASPTTVGTYLGVGYINITTPTNCNFLSITCKRPSGYPVFDASESLVVVAGIVLDASTLIHTVPDRHSYRGKIWTVVGDSLTAITIRSTKNYYQYVSDMLGVAVNNMGASGSGFKRGDDVGNGYYQRISSVPLNSNVVTIWGSGNDMGSGATLGEVADTGTTTLCGCINTTIDNLFAILPTVALGIVTPSPWGSYPPTTTGNAMELYADKLVAICKLRGIPCLDLYHSSGLRPWIAGYLPLMYSRDEGNSVHPDENGHRLIASQWCEFVKTLLLPN